MKTRQLVLAAVFAALIAVIAPLSIPTGIVPLTLQTVIIPLIASVTITRIAFSAVSVYLLLGAIGLPVYAGWSSGVGNLFGPTGGYLFGMLLFPLIIGVGTTISRHWSAMFVWNALAGVLQLSVGTAWLAVAAHMPIGTAVNTGLVAFIGPMFIKVTLITVVTVMLSRVMPLPIGKD